MCIYHAGSADKPTVPSALMTSPSFRGDTVSIAGLIHSLSLSSRGYLETVGLESEDMFTNTHNHKVQCGV